MSEELLKKILAKLDGMEKKQGKMEEQQNTMRSEMNKRFDDMQKDIKMIKKAVVEDKENIHRLGSKLDNHSHKISKSVSNN